MTDLKLHDLKRILCYFYFQGYHYLCLLCGQKYFKYRWQVVSHLQDMHSGISYLCLLCGQIYARRTIPHACNAKEKDFIYIHGESGIQGDAARKILDRFINERQDKNWKYVASEECPSEASTPQHKVKSSVKKIEKGRVPTCNKNDKKGDLQKKVYSPIPLGYDPQV